MDTFFFTTEKIELKDEGEDSYVYGYISTRDKDLVNDIVTENCMKSMFNQMKSRVIKFDIEHESFRGKSDTDRELNKSINPIAKVDWFGQDSEGILVKAILNKHHQRFDEVKGSIEDGFLDSFSIAYIPTKTFEDTANGESTRKLDDVRLLNVAFTGIPINEKSRFTEVVMKSLDSFNAHGNPHDKNLEGKGMTEENKEENKEETKEKKVEAKSEKKTEEKSEEESSEEEKPEEPKPDVSASLKALEEKLSNFENQLKEKAGAEDIKSMLKEIKEDVDKIKKEPQMKAVQEDMKRVLSEAEQKATETKGPIDYIY